MAAHQPIRVHGQRAIILAGLEDWDGVMTALTRATDERDIWLVLPSAALLRSSPVWDPIRKETWFQGLQARLRPGGWMVQQAPQMPGEGDPSGGR
jgi:hypothetical protein